MASVVAATSFDLKATAGFDVSAPKAGGGYLAPIAAVTYAEPSVRAVAQAGMGHYDQTSEPGADWNWRVWHMKPHDANMATVIDVLRARLPKYAGLV